MRALRDHLVPDFEGFKEFIAISVPILIYNLTIGISWRNFMNVLRQMILCVGMAFAAPLAAEPLEISEQDAASLEIALDRGMALRQYDQAAWHSTDSLREDIADLGGSGIRGWVVTPVENGYLTTYWKPDGESFAGVYSAVWTGARVIERTILEGDQTRLSETQIRMIVAQNSVSGQDLERCSNAPFNTVVLPRVSDDQPDLVYLLTPQTTFDAIPLGGHYRFAIKDGEVVSQRKFMKTCFNSPLKSDEKDNEIVSTGITHLLDPVPTELHVFSVFAAKRPIYVITVSNKHGWVVEVSGGQPRVRRIK